jgi:methyl-accepting chemotaxis protein
MKSIKYRMLLSFLAIAVFISGLTAGLVSWKLDEKISQQSDLLVEGIKTQTIATLISHNDLLNSFIDDKRQSVSQSTDDVGQNPVVVRNIESQQLAPLADLLKRSCKTAGNDFGFVFDLDGRLQASFPKDVDTGKLEEYYASSENNIYQIVQKIRDGKADPEAAKLNTVSGHDADFLKMIGLAERDVRGKGGIVLAASTLIIDDFGDAMGVYVTGKLLNDYNRPLTQISKIGSVGVIYRNTTPIAYAGIQMDKDSGIESLQLNPEVLEKIYSSTETLNVTLTLAGKKYLTACSAIPATTGEKIGVLLTGLAEEQIFVLQKKMRAYGIETQKSVQFWFIVIGAVSLTVFAIISLVISTGISRSIKKVIQGLNEGADLAVSVSNQISLSSQSLAEGSSEQAAAIEETSSSLEEMSSVTNQNAKNASQADELMQEANRVISQAVGSMDNLDSSMGEISGASKETSKIIKTIDEISFQTNLLALNAAVEAARAGEAGAGFAVVADEVRNLAMRAAEAAKNTASMIEGIEHKIQSGSQLMDTTSASFSEVSASTAKVGNLVGEIAAASLEQAQGIEQVNKAAVEVDKVAQQNAAYAQESASASAVMKSQAERIRKMVKELVVLVDGRSKQTTQSAVSVVETPGKITRNAHSDPQGRPPGRAFMAEPLSRKVSPEKLIPLDTEDFKDF